MISEGTLLKMIQQAVRAELAPILMGQMVSTDSADRSTVVRFATDSPQDGLRNITPYGLISRAPAGMDCLSVPLAHDPSNRVVLGHFNQGGPDLAEGEVALIGPAGQAIIFKADGRILSGDGGGDASEPVVLGNVLVTLLTNLIQAFTNASMIGIDSLGGPVQLSPDLKSKLAQLVSTYLSSASTNILSQKSFVERD